MNHDLIPPLDACADFTVYLIGADTPARDRMTLALAYGGYCLQVFEHREDFVAAGCCNQSGCVVAMTEIDDSADDTSIARLIGDSTPRPAPPTILAATAAPARGVSFVRRAFLGGAIDVLPADCNGAELAAAIDRARAADARRRRHTWMLHGGDNGKTPLTGRETEIARLVRQGLNNRAIADKLGISPRTVETHKTRLQIKLTHRQPHGRDRLAARL